LAFDALPSVERADLTQATGVTHAPRPRLRRAPLAACVLLFLVYVALSFANDPRGTLGTDSGGKLATLHAMEHTGRLVPDVGYWAAPFDSRGELHPLYYTERVGHDWVNVTTLPMVYAGWPLYELG